MPFWLEMILKFIVFAAAAILLVAACLVALLMIANGNATVAEFWNWKIAVLGLVLGAFHCTFIVAGCRSAWKFIDGWSDELRQSA